MARAGNREKMMTKQATKRTTVAFFVLTVGLWGVQFFLEESKIYCQKLFEEESDTLEVQKEEKGADFETGRC